MGYASPSSRPFGRNDVSDPLVADPWFGSLAPTVQQRLRAAGTQVRFPAGAFLFRQGDVPSGFLGLVHGSVKISTLREDGREAILAVLRPGNWFGEGSMVDRFPRVHDATAAEACELLLVPPDTFEALMRDADFARAIALLASLHARAVFGMLEDATLRSTRAQVARRLQRLAGGFADQPPVQPELEITQDALAMMLGITRQTLALELKAMVTAGAITLGYGRIRIESFERLKALEAP